MITIPIKLSSIKLNPNYNSGFKTNYVNSRVETTFTYKGKPLDWLLEEIKNAFNENFNKSFNHEFIVTSYGTKGDDENIIICEGVIYNPHNIPEKFMVKGFKIIIDHKYIDVPSYFSASKYSFEYKKVKVKCSACKSMIDVDDIEEYCDGDEEYGYNKCPECDTLNSFEDYKYETIEDAVKRKEKL